MMRGFGAMERDGGLDREDKRIEDVPASYRGNRVRTSDCRRFREKREVTPAAWPPWAKLKRGLHVFGKTAEIAK